MQAMADIQARNEGKEPEQRGSAHEPTARSAHDERVRVQEMWTRALPRRDGQGLLLISKQKYQLEHANDMLQAANIA